MFMKFAKISSDFVLCAEKASLTYNYIFNEYKNSTLLLSVRSDQAVGEWASHF